MVVKRRGRPGPDAHRRAFFTRGDRAGQLAALTEIC
jgi:hypothetical protein